MRRKFFTILLLLLFFLFWCFNEMAFSVPEPLQIYNMLLEETSLGDDILYDNNLTGRIVWNEASFMESLINVYELTREKRYIELFVKHADHVLQVRDDKAGLFDHTGKSRPGWQTGGYYTLGVPVVIPDDSGNPSLEVRGIHSAGNNFTVVEIIREEDGRFSLLVYNDFRRDEPLTIRFSELTMETIEAVVNKDINPASWIRVRVVGNSPPRQGRYELAETYRVVLHELHTPIIGLPLLRFADLVFRSPELASYEAKAEEYVQAMEESFRDYLDSWREDEEGGYFVFNQDGFWASGFPLPYNGLSANGRFLLWLWRVTGNPEYLQKCVALARKIRAGLTFLPDGTITMPYWIKGSLPYTGWKSTSGEAMNGLYTKINPDPATEDVSHFTLTLRFMVEAYEMGIVFSEDDLKAIARTFVKRLWKPVQVRAQECCDRDWRKGFYLAHNLDGRGQAYDYAIATFALLSCWEPMILERALEVYKTRFGDISCIDVDYLYGDVMLGWSLLASGARLNYTIRLQEKPLYPFTLRSSAEEYVKRSRLVSLDEHGIPVTDYGTLHGGAGRRYNPTFIANYALALYRDYLVANDSTLLNAFEKQVQWFLDHKKQREWHGIEFWVWEFDFDNSTFGAKAPWVSALSQGRVMCVFLAAYDLTGNPEYIRAAEYAFRSFIVPVSAGGVTTFDNGVAWYEEVADEEAPSVKILNGHIAAVQGLWTFWKWTGRRDIKWYFDLGVAAVKRDIALYDAGFLSYYSQWPENPREYAPARDYNTLHVHQLLWLYEVTGDSTFLSYALRFARYDIPRWQIIVAGSTDPAGHGPENLFFEMYSKYWSHNQFPTWIQLDLKTPRLIHGVAMFGYTPKATPRDFRILASEDGRQWMTVLEQFGNEEQYFVKHFAPLVARFIKIVILKDNGNNNVALTGIAAIEETSPVAVSDWKSFSAAHSPAQVFDQGWKIPETGWIVIDLGGEKLQNVIVKIRGVTASCSFSLLNGNDLSGLKAVEAQIVEGEEGDKEVILMNPCRYLRIDFCGNCKNGELTVERVGSL